MGFFDFITNIFSKPDKGKKKSAAPKKAAAKVAPAKKVAKKAPSDTTPLSLDKSQGKKRKLSKKVAAAPIDEQALGFSISLKDEDEQSKKRETVRITVDGLVVLVHRLKKEYAVTDISATGLGFAFEKPRVKGGVMLKMDLILDGKVEVADLTCKVMRHDRGSVGCVFQELDRAQDDTVHRIVLLGQKQQSSRRNFQKDRNFKLPD